jgi:hypothetical protein
MIKGPTIEWTRTAAEFFGSGLGGCSRVRSALDLLPQRRSQIRRNAAIAGGTDFNVRHRPTSV